MELLYILEKLRFPGLNELMLLVTHFGEEMAFLAVVLVLYWCVNKRTACYVMAVGFLGTMASQALKLLCRVPRPWVLDPNFTILEQARAEAGGYSFPSGHSQMAVGTYGALALVGGKKWLRWVCIALAVLVPFSRMYVGVHTPQDVLVGAAIALVLVFALKPAWKTGNNLVWKGLFAGMLMVGMGYVCFVEQYPFPADVDADNLEHGLKNAYTLLGAVMGMALSWTLDEQKLHFPVKAVWWAQILKVVLGVALVLGLKEGLKAPLKALLDSPNLETCIRYLFVVIFAGSVWPLTFRWFEKLGRKEKY